MRSDVGPVMIRKWRHRPRPAPRKAGCQRGSGLQDSRVECFLSLSNRPVKNIKISTKIMALVGLFGLIALLLPAAGMFGIGTSRAGMIAVILIWVCVAVGLVVVLVR